MHIHHSVQNGDKKYDHVTLSYSGFAKTFLHDCCDYGKVVQYM